LIRHDISNEDEDDIPFSDAEGGESEDERGEPIKLDDL
jgi:hypothetical protein